MKTSELKRKTPLRANPAKPLRAKAPLKASGVPKKPAKARKPRQMPLKTLKLRCDVLWRTYVKRDQACFFAGAAGCGECNNIRFEAAHLIPRSRSARLKYDHRNGIKSCSRHHAMLDNKIAGTGMAWAHVLQTIPGTYERLLEESKNHTPMKRYEWEAVYQALKELS